jgi:hypothetical protein
LFHVTHLLFFPCLAVWLRARRAHTGAALAAGGGIVVGAYALVAFALLGKSPAQAWAWFRAAGHGFVYLIRPYNATDALQGLARSLIHAPYVHEADPAVVIGQILLGAIALGVLVVPPILRRASLPPLPWAALAAWAVPYAVMAFLFFGTDPERWIFVLPILWLLFAATRLPRLGRVLGGALLAVNLVTAALPGVTEIGPRWRARAVESLVEPGDLVIFPGHDWDEYIGFYDDRYVRVFPLSYYVGAYGVDGGLTKLEGVIAGTEQRGGRIFAVRVLDENPGARGWEELSLLSWPRERAVAWLGQRFVATRLEPIRGVEIFLLERPQKTETALDKPR